jgi:hypothetical protein
MNPIRRFALAALAVCVLAPFAHGQCVSLTVMGSAYTQNFDTLSNVAGSTTNTLTIPGWFMTESGGGARDNEQYAVDTGGSTTGDTYSYGAAGSTERALGQLRSGTLIPLFGACFTNNTGSTVNTLAVAYNGEEWRLGTAGRTDQMNFEYSLNATDLVTGTWTNAAALNFVTPDTVTTGAKNGNAAADRTAISSSITGLSIPNGATFWIRWNDTDATGADDGLAVDDFSLTPQASAVPLSSTGAASPSSVASGDTAQLTVTVTPANTPPSTGITVTGDLTSIGGSATQTFFDNGTNGDQTAGDNVFTYTTTATGSPGAKSIPISIGDAQARNATASISLNIVTLTPIHDIQGNGDTSPLVGQSVSTRGVVTGVRSNGYFIEMPDAQWDADPNTSEGIFVFTSSAPPAAAAAGNMVTVTGTVSEFVPSTDTYSPPQTELVSPTTTLFSTGNPMPTAVTITTADTNPAGTIRQLEKYAAMRVHVNTLNVVGPTGGTINEPNATSVSNGAFFGVLPGINRPFRELGIQNPDPIPNPPCCIPRFDLNPERIRVDSDAVGGTAIDVTAGATVTNITGPLDYVFRAYTIDVEPATVPGVSGNVTFTPVPPRTATEFTVGCQNIERFFDNVADGNGAVTLTTTAYNNRLNKASLLIRNVLLAPDILGVEEAETFNGLTNLANKINADAVAALQPNPNYVPYLVNGNDIGGINVGLLVNSTRVTVNNVAQAAGSLTATYTDPTNGSPALIWDRPPLVLDATVVGPPAVPIVIIVNHLRSLSGVDDPTPNGLSTEGDRVRQKRRAGAEWLANYIQSRLTANPNERLVLVGDFNAFEFNDGYVDVIGTIKGTPTPSTDVLLSSADLVNPDLTNLTDTTPATDRYSYNFDGDAQSIDHALINNNALLNFSRFAHGRVDADFPEAYRNDSTRPERLSDHDGEVIYFSLTPTLHFDVSIPSSVTAGVPFDGTVTVRDALGDVVTNYSGTVHVTSSDGTATLPADYTFTGGDAGVHTFSGGFTLNGPGSQSITATDTVNSSITGAGSTTVTCQEISVSASNNGPICENGTLTFDATDVTGAAYSWTGPNGFTAAVRNPSINNVTTAATGEYDLTINLDGCTYNTSTNATVDAMPATPTISGDTNGTGTSDQACPEQPLTLHANGAKGATSYTWYSDNAVIPNETSSTLVMTGVGNISVTATNGSCTTAHSATYVVQNPTPHSPFVSFRNQDSSVTSLSICMGTSQIIDSDSATGIQWYQDGSPILSGGGNQSYTFTPSTPGTYTFTAQLNALGCHSQFGRNVTITVNPLPATPTITGANDYCSADGGTLLTSSSATGNQWNLNGAPIGGATGQTFLATSFGDYTVTVTSLGCSATSAPHDVSVVPSPDPIITAPSFVVIGSTGNTASAPFASGPTYVWSITNGTITSGAGTNAITFTAGAAGTLTLQVTETWRMVDISPIFCSSTRSTNITVGLPAVTVTSVTPTSGSINGHTSVTINGTGFNSGAAVTFGGAAATNVVVVSATQMTAVTPAHAAGAVDVTVTNTDTTTGTLTNGFTYMELFDPNGDHTIDPSDIFYLINYIFMHGPAPQGGLASGDANGDGVIDPSDIFYLVNYLYLGGPAPYSEPTLHTESVYAPMKGSISLGEPVLRGYRYVIPVTVDGAASAMSLHLRLDAAGEGVTIRRASGLQPAFEISRHAAGELTYLVEYDGTMNGVVANIEVPIGTRVSSIEVDSDKTLLSTRDGMRKATVSGGNLTVSGVSIDDNRPRVETLRSER